MTKDDRFYLNRVALFAHAQQVGVTRACADFQVHRATYYRWRDQVARYGLEILRPLKEYEEERVDTVLLGSDDSAPLRRRLRNCLVNKPSSSTRLRSCSSA